MKSQFLIATAITALLTATNLSVAQAAEARHNAPAARPVAPHAAVHAPAPHVAPAVRPVARAPAPRAPVQPHIASSQSKLQARLGEPRGSNERRHHIGQSAQTSVSNSARKSDRERQNVQTQGGERRATAGIPARAAVTLSSEQRSRIREVILRQHAPRTARADFDIRVGERIPRDRLRFVDLVPLPQTIVEVEPAWEGYLYFLVGDEIVVVDPNTLLIVAVLPA
jgi:hypothetical protein